MPRMQLSLSEPADRQRHGGQFSVLWSDQDYRPRMRGVYAMKYMMNDRDPDPGRDVAWYEANHPDWVERKCDGAPAHEFHYSYGYNTPLDVNNQQVRAYLLEQNLGKTIHTGRFDAVSVDNVAPDNTSNRCGVKIGANFRRDYDGRRLDPAFTAAMADWMTWLKKRVHDAGLCLTGNDYFSDDDPQGFLRLAKVFDIVVDEHGFTRDNRPLSLDQAWRTRINTYLALPARQPLIIIDYPAATPAALTGAAISWSLANFLLIKRQGAYLDLETLDGFDKWREFRGFDLSVGASLGGIGQSVGVYSRRYEKAIAAVNPSSNRAGRLSLPPGRWKDLGGRVHTGELNLPAASAAVLTSIG